MVTLNALRILAAAGRCTFVPEATGPAFVGVNRSASVSPGYDEGEA